MKTNPNPLLLLLLLFCLTLLSGAAEVRAQGMDLGRIQGWCEQGGATVTTSGVTSSASTPVQRSYPGCSVTVYVAGTSTLAGLYSNTTGTILANPFVASSASGYWFFYAPAGTYDVRLSGAGLTAYTLPDVKIISSSGGGGTTISSLDDVPDVVLTSPTNGQVLKYNSTTLKWVNGADADSGGGALSGSQIINGAATLTLPTTTDTITGRATTDTLTNKTLTSPTVNGGTHTGITITGTTAGSPTISGTWTFSSAPAFNPASGAPFTTDSTVMVTNLNANSVGGQSLANLDTRYILSSGLSSIALAANGLTVGTNQLVAGNNNVGIRTVAPTSSLHVVGGGARMEGLATPNPPTVTPNTTGSTTYTYFVVAKDYQGRRTLASTATTIANGATTPNNTVTWAAVSGAKEYDVLKGNTATLLGTTTGLTLSDTNQATGAYTTPTRNETADLTVDGGLSLGGASLPANSTNILAATGNANISGTVTAGAVSAATIASTVATGTAPLTVASTTKVTNLNADTVDGVDGANLATNGLVTVSTTGGTTALTTSQYDSNSIFEFSGTLASNATITINPSGRTPKFFAVRNNTTGNFTLEIKTSSGTGVKVSQMTRTILYMDGTNVVEAQSDVPAAKATTGQTVSNNIDTTITFSTEEFDMGAMHSTSSNTDRFTVPVAGKYSVVIMAKFQDTGTSAGTHRTFNFRKNGVLLDTLVLTPNSENRFVQYSNVFVLAAGDYISTSFHHDRGSNMTLDTFTVIVTRIAP